MKNLIIAVFFFLIFLTSGLTQTTLNQVWNTNFTWGGRTDQTTQAIPNSSVIYINGWFSRDDSSHSALAKFHSSSGSTIWKKIDTTTLTFSDLKFCVLENMGKIFYLSSSNSGLYSYLIIRDKNTGEMIQIKPVSSRMSFFEYGSDSVIAVTSSSLSQIIILNSNGDSARSFPLGYSLNNGIVTVKRSGENIWIFGLYYTSQYNSFVEKRNIFSGGIIWRKEFLSSIYCYGDIDSAENTFVGNSSLEIERTTTMYKLNPHGEILWQKTHFGALNEVVLSKKNNIVIMGGERQMNTEKKHGLVYARNMVTGDSVFVISIEWDTSSYINDISSVACESDTSRNFYVLGKHINIQPLRTTCHLRKYFYDASIGIFEIGSEIPEKFALSQNYPNPFNPNTKIQFSLPKKSVITLKVFDILGREIATLVNGKMQSGSYVVDFDGSNLSSGIYFYRLEADGFREIKKMSLVK